jgi:predicted acyltransferase
VGKPELNFSGKNMYLVPYNPVKLNLTGMKAPTQLDTPPRRLLSLDVFRGATVMAMTLVNNPGDWGHIYAPLEHAAWNGCTLADLVFPFFLFIMGVSVVFAMANKKLDAAQHISLLLKALRRAVVLFALGLFMAIYLNWNLATLRIPGVLQRIAVVYLVCSCLYIKTGHRTQAVLFVLVLLAYYVLMTCVPVPGTGVASLAPETNLGAWLDRTLLGTQHLWQESKTWDPEGILSTLPAVATGLLGVLTGTWLKRTDVNAPKKIYAMLGAGLLLTGLGVLFNPWFPINKALWTSSYVLFTGGLALLCFMLCYWLIDVQGFRRFTQPFVVYGVNAILVFVVSGLMARSMNRIHFTHQGQRTSLSSFLYQTLFEPHFSPLNASLAWAISYVLLWLGVLWVLYRRGIVVKV